MRAVLRPSTTVAHPVRFIAGGALLVGLALALASVPIGHAGGVLVAALVVTAVALLPAAGLVLTAVAIPLGRSIASPLPGASWVDALVALTLFAWLLRGLSERRVVFRPPPLTWPLFAFLWVSGLSLTQAASWREGVPEWLKWVEFAALYLVGAQVLCRRSIRRAVIAALLLAGVSQAVIGAYQFLGRIGPEAFALPGGFVRAHGTFQQPNPYAGYLGYLVPLAVSLAMAAGSRWWEGRRLSDLTGTLAYAGAAVALAAGILMSWSRGAWIGLLASLAFVVGLRNRYVAAALLILAVLLVLVGTPTFGAGGLPGGVTARISDLSNYVSGPDPGRTEITDANFSVLERLAHWHAGWRMFEARPWLGVGIGNYATAYPAYALPHWYEPLGHAHNVFINFLAETGALGLTAFGAFWLGVGWVTWRRSNRVDRYERALALSVLGAWVYLSVHSIFDNLFVQHMQLQLALLLSLLAAELDRPS